MYASTMTNYKKKFTLGTCTILNIIISFITITFIYHRQNPNKLSSGDCCMNID